MGSYTTEVESLPDLLSQALFRIRISKSDQDWSKLSYLITDFRIDVVYKVIEFTLLETKELIVTTFLKSLDKNQYYHLELSAYTPDGTAIEMFNLELFSATVRFNAAEDKPLGYRITGIYSHLT